MKNIIGTTFTTNLIQAPAGGILNEAQARLQRNRESYNLHEFQNNTVYSIYSIVRVRDDGEMKFAYKFVNVSDGGKTAIEKIVDHPSEVDELIDSLTGNN